MKDDVGESFSLSRWIARHFVLLILFLIVVLYQTRGFGYWEPAYIRMRQKEEAEKKIAFGRVHKTLLREGAGEAITAGKWVLAHFTGYSENGMQFWSTRFDRAPYLTEAGKGKVIPGLDRALLEMKKGEQARFSIPPDLGFGDRGKKSWHIDPWEILVFEIEVLEVYDEAPPQQEKPRVEERPPPREVPKEEPRAEEDKPPVREAIAQPEGMDSPLFETLQKLSLDRFAGELVKVGLTTKEDLRMVDSSDDLPEEIPKFARKKLAVYAAKWRKAEEEREAKGGKKEEGEKKEDRPGNGKGGEVDDSGSDGKPKATVEEDESKESCPVGGPEGGTCEASS